MRHLSVELEWVEGHLESLADGHVSPSRATLSRVGDAWRSGAFTPSHGLTEERLWQFLQDVLRVFHYVPGDVEWAWDGSQLWLLQYRPISDRWRRHLTAANIARSAPQPAFLSSSSRRAAASIRRSWRGWYARVLQETIRSLRFAARPTSQRFVPRR